MTTKFGVEAPLWGLLLAALVTSSASARMVKDARGNVGFEGVAECDAAVESGAVRFYSPDARKSPLLLLLRPGEASVKAATLAEVVIPLAVSDLKGFRSTRYALGACDMGAAGSGGRDGVTVELQGKYVPYSPSLPVNVYLDAAGNPVRVSMRASDNVFSGNFPRPVPDKVVIADPPALPLPPARPQPPAAPRAMAAPAPPAVAVAAPAPISSAATSAPTATPPLSVRAAVAQANGGLDTSHLVMGASAVVGLGLLVTAGGDSGTAGSNGTTGSTGTTGTN